MRKPGKKITIRSLLVLLCISAIICLLADRYLVEHVEQLVTHSQTETYQTTEVQAEYDDWNYQSENISIHIDQVVKGSGTNKVTYFIADVVLSDASYFRTAFAKNMFGRNIVEDTSQIAGDNHAIFAINGDYYGFRNDGIIIRNGEIYRDSPVRTALSLYKNGTMDTFEEKDYSAASLLEAGVTNTFSFGPELVVNGEAVEDFGRVTVDTNFGNRSIQNNNPRTGIGMIAPNHFVFVVVDGRKDNYSKGMTLEEFAQLFADLGCTEAYNLDGGGSSTMVFMGRVVNNPLGKQDERKVSDIIFLTESFKR
jgi:exopolysaccharide biosynthesis protein